MSRRSKSSDALDVAERFHAQADYLKNKRSVRISLADFAPSTSIGIICDTLVSILSQYTPPLQLERIFVSENQLSSLPSEFWPLCGPHLRTLDLHKNQLTKVPDLLAQMCPNLEILDLSGNHITSLSESSLSAFRNLKVLSLKDNRITHLPPILGEMISLESLTISGNPLVFPPLETVNSMQGGINDLKAFLVSNSAVYGNHLDTYVPAVPRPTLPSTPSLARTRSLSDTRSRSSKASRRMGLIINSNKVTPDKPSLGPLPDTYTPSKPERKLSLPSREKSDFSALTIDMKSNTFVPEMPSISSPQTLSMPFDNFSASNSVSPPKSTATLAPMPISGTMKSGAASARENEHSPDDFGDTDPKPSAYFRRLSVLRESPSDDIPKTEPHQTKTGDDQDGSKIQPVQTYKPEVSPLKNAKRKVSTSQQHPYPTQHNINPQAHPLRNSTLHEKSVIVKVSRKILFSFSELHLSIKRFAGFCGDKKLSSKIVRLIHSSKEHIDDLVEAMEAVEDGEENQALVVTCLHSCINSFKTILATISENFSSLVARIDPCFIRMVLLTLFGSLHELQNAHKLLNQANNPMRPHPSLTRNTSSLASSSLDLKAKYSQSNQGGLEDIALETPSISSATEAVATLEEIDERLYQTVSSATDNAQVVFSELTKTISKSAIASANTNNPQSFSPSVTAKFKELTHVCMTSMEITKRLVAKLSGIRPNQDSTTRRSFWDDINLFLKAVIQTFSAVKDIMKDAPIFNEVRWSMANLTKTTKELTIILEASSYKAISDTVDSPANNNMWHMSNGPPTSASTQIPSAATTIPPVRTPLVATVGTAAAQALLAQQDTQYAQTGHHPGNSSLPPLHIPPSVVSDTSHSGLHTAPVQSMEQYYAKNVNPFDRI
ncbi:hypothetical protein JCM33374_g1269 [Metschnikowia sp. JCM 33374]|nr:hypothetical protein JCM33374_g1269 [Metschnikowia sp. JCM 33374]